MVLAIQRIIRNRELSLATPQEIQTALGKQRITEEKGWPLEELVRNANIHKYILTFDRAIIPREIKIGCYSEKVELYIFASLKCFQYQKYGCYKLSSRGCSTCERCGQKDPAQYKGRLSQWNQMFTFLREPFHLLKNLQYMRERERERDHGGKI